MGGFSPGPDPGGYGDPSIWAALLGLLAGIIDALIYQIAAAFSVVGDDILALWGGASFLFGGVGSIFGFFKSLFSIVLAGLVHIITDILHGNLKAVLQDITDLLHKLHELVGPIIAVLRRLQQIQRQLHTQAMRQLIDLIQRARKILVIFRLLHFGWAKKLDAYLVGFESDLARKWLNLVRHINQVTGVLDLILDPRGLLRPGHTLASIGAAIGAVQQAAGALGLRQLLCLPADTYAAPVLEPWAVTSGRLIAEIRTNTGDYAAAAARRDALLRQYAIDLGVTPLVH